jgi:hypothetical protein
MHRIPPIVPTDEELLGQLAFRFRGSRRDDERRKIADDYAATVDRLIKSRMWDEMPGPEDQLPDEFMPQAFWNHWLGWPRKP